MSKVRFLMIGGFLGAGKTTAIARLARHYLDHGRRVGLVTNDQAYGLVDTYALRAQGFQVGEVPGACFCCKFQDLVKTVGQLSAGQQPDVIIAEPVGSCTDLVATVIEPLRQRYGQLYEMGPLAVLLKPEHGDKILRAAAGVGFSPKAAYIFLKQIEEADVVALNKIDKLSADEQRELRRLVGERFPSKKVVAISARTGEGFDALTQALTDEGAPHQTFVDVDYDTYAEGEAELGWLNCTVRLESNENPGFRLDTVVTDLVERIRQGLAEASAEPAHLKILGHVDDAVATANLVGSTADVELSHRAEVQTRQAEVIVNARVATSPDRLEHCVRRGIDGLASEHRLTYRIESLQRFRPSRPVPTHRL